MSKQNTRVSIQGSDFLINDALTYEGVSFNGHRIEGLLLNTRMVQATFDDLNAETRHQWAYADTGEWSAERNVSEFLAAMPMYREHGVLAVTVNLQGGSPYGYSKAQPWVNSAINADGSLREDYLGRLARVIERADELGMVVIVGIFYFGQEKVLRDAQAIRDAVDNTSKWLLTQGYTNVLLEINNECNIIYKQPLLMPDGVHELISQAKQHEVDGRRLLVGTSYGGGFIPKPNVVKVSDFLLMHGNGVEEPAKIAEMVRQARAVEGYTDMPILFNEDDHFDFDKPENNFLAAISEHASWGYFDYRMKDEGYEQGYQSVPVDWGINSERKRGFFSLAKTITQGN